MVKTEVVKKTELVKKGKAIQTTDTSNLVKKKLTMTQKLVKLKKKITDHDHSNKHYYKNLTS